MNSDDLDNLEFPQSYFNTLENIDINSSEPETKSGIVPLDSPFIILVDSREQAPFEFKNIVGDFRNAHAPIRVRTKRKGLKVGDYQIDGISSICIERKSHEDLFSSMHGKEKRENFVERLRKMDSEFEFSSVVVECSISDVHNVPLSFTSLNPLSVIRSTLSWAQQFPRVHWMWAESREMAEGLTYRILELHFRHIVELKYHHHNKPIDNHVEAFREGQLARMSINEVEIPYSDNNPLRKSFLRGWSFYSTHFLSGDLGRVWNYGTMPVSGESKSEAKKRERKSKKEDGGHIPLPGQKSFLDPLEELKSITGLQFHKQKNE